MRNTDWRIHLSPQELKYKKINHEEKVKILKKKPLGLWGKYTENVAANILATVGFECKIKSDYSMLNKELIEKILEIESIVLKKHPEHRRIDIEDAESYAICMGIGAALAKLCPPDLKVFEKLAESLYFHHTIYITWLDHLPEDTMEHLESDLMYLPQYEHPLELVESWGYYRDKKYWDSYDEMLLQTKQTSRDEWHFVSSSHNVGSEIRLSSSMRIKNDVLFNTNKKQWIYWVFQLPNIHIQMAAVAHIRSLALWTEILLTLFELTKIEESLDKKKVKIVATLFFYEYLKTAETIDFQLNHWANDRWVYSEEDKEILFSIQGEKEKWQSNEWHEGLKQLIEQLAKANNELLIELIKLALCNIQIDALPKKRIYLEVRDVFIMKLVEEDFTFKQILPNNPTTVSLLVSMQLYYESKDEEECSELWTSYLTVIKNKSFYWSTDFNHNLDYFKFAWYSAGILAQQVSPFDQFRKAIKEISWPKEGWIVPTEKVYEVDKQVVHLYIIGAMASEWLLAEEKDEEAVQLYKYVFDETTNYLRSSVPYHLEFVDRLILELWARLSTMYPTDYEEIARETISLYDEYKHILLALTVLHNNTNTGNELKFLMQKKHDELYPFERLNNSRNDKLLKWYETFDWWIS